MENSNDSIGNRTRDLPTCSAVPQPTVPPPAPVKKSVLKIITVAQKTGRLKGYKELAVAYLKTNRGVGRLKDH